MSLFRQQPQNRQGRVGWGVGSGEPTTRRGGEKWKTQIWEGGGVEKEETEEEEGPQGGGGDRPSPEF